MITFKQYINETFDITDNVMTNDDLIELIKTKCSDALWMFHEDFPIYRGESSKQLVEYVQKNGSMVIDPSKTTRQSVNTTNHYTLMLDNNPKNKSFPKRSRSFICTTDKSTANGYGSRTLRIIPFNNTKIGVVNKLDLWELNVSIFGKTGYKIVDINDSFNRIDSLSQTDWATWKKFDVELKNKNPNAIEEVINAFEAISVNEMDHFLESIFSAYDLKKMGCTLHTTKNLKGIKKSEVWVGGPCLILSADEFNRISKEL